MGYQVLARKYRPQRFADVAGQDHVTRTLLNALTQSRIAHGYIFSGHRGIGKTTIARILAQALNCRTEVGSADRPSPEPCGKCDSCIEVRQGNGRGRDRNRRGHQSRHRRDSRTPRCRPLCPGTRPLQDLHPRRSPPDHRSSIQCPAENAGGTALARHLHDGHHRAGKHSADHSLALPALQLSRRPVRRHPGAIENDRQHRNR